MIRALFSQAVNDLLDHKARVILTGLGILISMALFTSLLGYGSAMRSTLSKQMAGISTLNEVKGVVRPSSLNLSQLGEVVGAGQKNSPPNGSDQTGSIDSTQIEKINQWSEVESAVPDLRLPMTIYWGNQSIKVTASCNTRGEKNSGVHGAYIAEELQRALKETGGQDEVIRVVTSYAVFDTDEVSRSSLNPLRSEVDTLRVWGAISSRPGLLSAGSKLYLDRRLCDSLYWKGAGGGMYAQYRLLGGYPGVNVVLNSRHDTNAVSDRLSKMGLSVWSAEEVTAKIERIVLFIEVGLYLLTGLAFLISSLGLMNTVLMNVSERTSDIGIMRTVGAKTKDIKFIFVVQGLTIGFVFGVAGISVGAIIMNIAEYGVNKYLSLGSTIYLFEISLFKVVGLTLFAVLSSGLVAVWPAENAASIEPVVAVRQRG
jgi:ABC-type antimicrobial peptide transport system permease subunit